MATSNDELLIILSDYLNDIQGLKKRNGKLPAQAAIERIEVHTEQRVLKVRAEDTERLYKLNKIVKRYNIVNFVKLYNEAIKRDWQDIRVPIIRDLSVYSPDDLAILSNKGDTNAAIK